VKVLLPNNAVAKDSIGNMIAKTLTKTEQKAASRKKTFSPFSAV
jgi:hypothetical protein